MITIPTGDLVGILEDAVPFASTEKNYPDIHCVRVFWDGSQLNTQAHDGVHMGWSRWSAGENHVQDHAEDPSGGWGGADNPWSVTVRLDDAAHLIKTYTLPQKAYFVPLTVEATGNSLRIQRSRDTGRSAIATVVRHHPADFSDLAQYLAENGATHPAASISVDAKRLASFGKVRPRGALAARFTPDGGPVLVSIGSQFTGAIKQLGEYRKPPGTEEVS